MRIPESPAGEQLRWYLGRLASSGEDASDDDGERFSPDMPRRRWAVGEGDIRETWRLLAGQTGARELTLVSVDERSECAVEALLKTGDGKEWGVSFVVEEAPPHRIFDIDWRRKFEFEVTVREGTQADSAVLADIERRCPIELGDVSVAFDRGDDYFAFARLMEDVMVGLGSVDGVPAAINCIAVHGVRVGGVEGRLMTAIHTRILPEHQRKGLWGAVSRFLSERFGEKYGQGGVLGSRGFVAAANAAMQRGFANMPNKWHAQALRAQLDCSALAGPQAGRSATPQDAARVAEVLNACHEAEEMYLPYTDDSLAERLARAPTQYSWERVWMTDGAVVGVWPAGESIRAIIESNGKRTESRRGLVLDYGFLPGAEGELEALLRGWCGWLHERGVDTLSIFTSERSSGYELMRALASTVDAFNMWTPGLPEPTGAPERGLYVDQVYF